jgi:predicted nucleic acid-binding protein
MTKPVMPDSGPLGRIAHPRPNPEIREWMSRVLSENITVIIPEIADYEVRRNLLLSGLTKSVMRLDRLREVLAFQPITTGIMLKAAELWAKARRQGRPTADPKELDGDVILAAQAIKADAIVITENIGHLSLFAEAVSWRNFVP